MSDKVGTQRQFLVLVAVLHLTLFRIRWDAKKGSHSFPMILRQLGAKGGRDDPFSYRVCLTGDACNRIRSKEDFLLQIDAKLSDPTFFVLF